MKRATALSGAIVAGSLVLLTGCLPASPSQIPLELPPPAATVDLGSTAEVMAATLSALTIEAWLTTTVPPTATFTPIFGATPAVGTVTPTPTGTGPLESGNPASATAGSDTSSGGNELPGHTPSGPIHIVNKSGTQADISLHCTTRRGLFTILEFENVRNLGIDAPLGDYVYVVYVGGRRLIGDFSFLTEQKLTITIYKDRVIVH